MNLIHDVGFDHSYSFIYSARPARLLHNYLTMYHWKLRNTLSYFAKPHSTKCRQISESMIGSTQKILVSGAAIKHAGQLSGRSENNRVVNFFWRIELIGKLVPVKITEVLPNSLRGELL